MADKLDLSNIALEDLIDIQNQVLQRVAAEAKLNVDLVAAGHDSHGSNHSNNKMPAPEGLQQQLARLARPKG